MTCLLGWGMDNQSLTWDHSKPQWSNNPINCWWTKSIPVQNICLVRETVSLGHTSQ